ncbi:unnamed protein product [Symbiodinium natans]|uniref:Uncharacterized protein n=1 Tax=Symbiodinium natans TaxID=878477 RepID=A0A812SIF1_9DINO|nr:unnamed protein product [Symbiodinium natans]
MTLSYHALILTGQVDYRFVWGGRLKSKEQMYVFETVSVSLNLIMVLLALARGGWLNACPCLPPAVLRVVCGIFCALFALNTLGNLAAKSNFERGVFTPLTLLASLAFARLALE